MPLRVAVSGATGRMGLALARLVAAADDLELAGGIARVGRDEPTSRELGYPRIEAASGAPEVLASADVLIDFSAPDHLDRVLSQLAPGSGPGGLVIGTTGLTAALDQRMDELARERAVVLAANFSVGVQLLLAMVEMAAAGLPAADYDVEVVEAHHRAKADAPSGTALALAEAAARARGESLQAVRRDGRSGRTGARPAGEVGIHAVRGGGIVGDHRVLFLGGRERLELAHGAVDRAVFAEGALRAARWIHGRPPGRYAFRHVLGLGSGSGTG